MASITKRHGKWQARVNYYDENGKRRSKSKSGFKTKREAQLFANDYELKANNNELGPDTEITLAAYFKQWYELYKTPAVSPRTLKAYEYTFNVINKYLPKMQLTNLNAQNYQKFLQKYGVNHAKATVHKVNTCIHACIRNAVYDDIVKRDFITRTTLIFDKKRTQQIEYLNIKEMQQLTAYILKKLNPKYASGYMILTAIYTGMRLGEIQGLQWRDINFNFKTINIERAYNELNHEFKETKNKTSKRIIRINDDLLNVFKQLKKVSKPKSDKTQIFLGQSGKVPTSNAVNKALRNALKANQINRQGFHFHSLRHTHVAYLLANQIDLYAISKRLGHADIGITSKIYSYMIDEYQVRTDNQIADTLQNIVHDLCTEPSRTLLNQG